MKRGAADILDLFSGTPDTVVRSVDPKIRPDALPSRSHLLAITGKIAALSHIVKLSDEDTAWLHPGAELDTVIDHDFGLAASVVAITLGAAGCLVASRSARVTRCWAPVDVVDTIGAGVAFMPGLLHVVHALTLTDSLRFRNRLAADLTAMATGASESARIAVSRAGSNPPRCSSSGHG